jgi:hypothetical protein
VSGSVSVPAFREAMNGALRVPIRIDSIAAFRARAAISGDVVAQRPRHRIARVVAQPVRLTAVSAPT